MHSRNQISNKIPGTLAAPVIVITSHTCNYDSCSNYAPAADVPMSTDTSFELEQQHSDSTVVQRCKRQKSVPFLATFFRRPLRKHSAPPPSSRLQADMSFVEGSGSPDTPTTSDGHRRRYTVSGNSHRSVYTRPPSTPLSTSKQSVSGPGSSGASPQTASPQRLKLFGSIRLGRFRRGSVGEDDCSLAVSGTPPTSTPQEYSVDCMEGGGVSAKKGSLFDNFRPRSKSDSRQKAKVVVVSQYPRLESIDSVDEQRERHNAGAVVVTPERNPHSGIFARRLTPNGGGRDGGAGDGKAAPLYVDTQLANRANDKPRRSPIARAVRDFVGMASGGGKNNAQHHRAATHSFQCSLPTSQQSSRGAAPMVVDSSVDPQQLLYGMSPLRSPSTTKTPSPHGRFHHRLLSPSSHQPHSLDSGLDSAACSSPSSAAIYYRHLPAVFANSIDVNSSVVGPFSAFSTGSFADPSFEYGRIIFENQDTVYSMFMQAHKCYDLIPTSTKLIVFDTQLPVRKAFFALVYNSIRAAPLWDSVRQEFVGMLTITDFIRILVKCYKQRRKVSEQEQARKSSSGDDVDSGESSSASTSSSSGITLDDIDDGIKQLEHNKITTWRDALEKDGQLTPLITIDPNESLHRAIEVLCESKVHRLPVMDKQSGNVSFLLTHKRLIKFLFIYINDLPQPSFLDRTPKEFNIGTWGNIETVSPSTPLIDALALFLERRISALPLVDDQNRVVDIYSRFDAINLAAEKTYTDLDITVEEALKHRAEWFEGVRTCNEHDSIRTIIELIVKVEVHRLIVLNAEQRVVGLISLSDLLKHLVLRPPVTGHDCEASEASDVLGGLGGDGSGTGKFHLD